MDDYYNTSHLVIIELKARVKDLEGRLKLAIDEIRWLRASGRG